MTQKTKARTAMILCVLAVPVIMGVYLCSGLCGGLAETKRRIRNEWIECIRGFKRAIAECKADIAGTL